VKIQVMVFWVVMLSSVAVGYQPMFQKTLVSQSSGLETARS